MSTMRAGHAGSILYALLLCSIVVLIATNPIDTKADSLPTSAEYGITVDRPDCGPATASAGMADAGSVPAWFDHLEADLMPFDGDGRGETGDAQVTEGPSIQAPLRHDIATLLGRLPEGFTVNVQFSPSGDRQRLDLTVSVIKAEPAGEGAIHAKRRHERFADAAPEGRACRMRGG